MNQVGNRSRAIILAQERLADEKRVEAGGAQTVNILTSFDSALGDFHDALRHQRRETFRRREIDVERAEVAVVDTDQSRATFDGSRELVVVMHLDERVAAELVEDADGLAKLQR